MANEINPQTQTMIDNMPEKTGKSLEEWFAVIKSAGLEKHGDIMKLLKGEYGVTHGFANTISALYRQQAAGGPPAEEDLVSAQYQGKENLLPIYDKILAITSKFGRDVEIAPKKNYVSLRRSKQFAIVQPSTKTRVDLGLNLKDVPATDRLEGGNVFSGMCTHRVRLSSPDNVDGEVVTWLEQAYKNA